MKKLIPLLFLAGCSSIDTAINELPLEAKQGCYYKAVTATGNGVYTNGSYGKDAVFCTKELPENYCYKSNSNGVQVQVGDCK